MEKSISLSIVLNDLRKAGCAIEMYGENARFIFLRRVTGKGLDFWRKIDFVKKFGFKVVR